MRARYGDPAVIGAFLAQANIPLLREVWEALEPLEALGLVLNWQGFAYQEGVGQQYPTLTLTLAYRPEAFELLRRRGE